MSSDGGNPFDGTSSTFIRLDSLNDILNRSSITAIAANRTTGSSIGGPAQRPTPRVPSSPLAPATVSAGGREHTVITNNYHLVRGWRGPPASAPRPEFPRLSSGESPGSKEATLQKFLRTIAHHLRALYRQYPELKSSKSIAATELKKLTAGEDGITALADPHSSGQFRVPVRDEKTEMRYLDIALGGGPVKDQLMTALRKIGELWEYNRVHWLEYYNKLEDMENTRELFFSNDQLVVRKAYDGLLGIVELMKDELNGMGDLSQIESYITSMDGMIKAESKNIDISLVTVDYLRGENARLRQELSTAQKTIIKLRESRVL